VNLPNINELKNILNAQLAGQSVDDHSNIPFAHVSTDTRTLKSGDIFLALRGENFDGHQFIERAITQGAKLAIVDRQFQPPAELISIPILQVDNTLTAYQAIAHWWRKQLNIPIIAITGSVGKTTTKELIAAVLGIDGAVLKTQANYNNEIGVPKTILEITPEHQYAVIEMGMRGREEIALLTQIAQPNIGVITNVGTAHIERLGSEQAIAEAKCELLREMPQDSIAILNYDNQRLRETAPQFWSGKTITYGLTGGDLQGNIINDQIMQVAGLNLPLPLTGKHNAINYLAALAVYQAVHPANSNLSKLLAPFTAGLTVNLPAGRAKKIVLANNITLLDETYNAGLESMTAALHLLAETAGKRRIAVLGTMKELGDYSLEFHRKIGDLAKRLKLDALFIFADPGEAQAMEAGAEGIPYIYLEDVSQAEAHTHLAKNLKEFLQPDDVVLCKASHSVALDKVVQLLQDT
jgi:UDP-N-acetylmuramoyl-tripeptide--D-alanyl-D-alanine ligase